MRCGVIVWVNSQTSSAISGTLFHVAIWIWDQSCPWGDWYWTLINRLVCFMFMSVPYIFHGRNRNTQLSRIRSIAITLFQINYLVIVANAHPSHFRPWFHMPVMHLKHGLWIYNLCHCFMSLDGSKVSRVVNFIILAKWSILSNVSYRKSNRFNWNWSWNSAITSKQPTT